MKQLAFTIVAALTLTACGSNFRAADFSQAKATGSASSSSTDDTTVTTPTTTGGTPTPNIPSFSATDLQSFLAMLGTDLQGLFQLIEKGTGPGITFDTTTGNASLNKTIPCPHGGSVTVDLHSHVTTSLTNVSMTGPTSASSITFASCSPGATLALNGTLSIPNFSHTLNLSATSLTSATASSQGQVQASGNLSVTLSSLATTCPTTLMISESANFTTTYDTTYTLHGSGSGSIQLNGSVCGMSGSQNFALPISF